MKKVQQRKRRSDKINRYGSDDEDRKVEADKWRQSDEEHNYDDY